MYRIHRYNITIKCETLHWWQTLHRTSRSWLEFRGCFSWDHLHLASQWPFFLFFECIWTTSCSTSHKSPVMSALSPKCILFFTMHQINVGIGYSYCLLIRMLLIIRISSETAKLERWIQWVESCVSFTSFLE